MAKRESNLRSFRPKERRRVQKIIDKPSRTKQAYGPDSDINNILKKYAGIPPKATPIQYGDMTMIPDFQQALNTVIVGRDMFDRLPSNIRERFGNDPSKYLEFVQAAGSNEELKAEGVRLGIFKKEAKAAPPAAPEPSPSPSE